MKFVDIFAVIAAILGLAQFVSAYICARDLYSGKFQNFPSIYEMRYQNLQGGRELFIVFFLKKRNVY